jgi:hypothetical protein
MMLATSYNRVSAAIRRRRERRTPVGQRVNHVNRIKGLLFAHGVFGYEPLRQSRIEPAFLASTR